MAIKLKSRSQVARDGSKLHTLRTTLQSVSANRRAAELKSKLGIGSPGVTKIKFTAPSTDADAVTSENILQRKLWNRSMPVLNCSNCTFSSQCQKYRAGYECAFLPFFTSHTIQTTKDILFYSKELLQQGIRRVQQAMMFETMSGAAPSIELSEQLSNLFAQLSTLYDQMKADASVEIETSSDTLVGSLFGDSQSLIESTEHGLAAISELNAMPEISNELRNVSTGTNNPEVHQDLMSHLAKTSRQNES